MDYLDDVHETEEYRRRQQRRLARKQKTEKLLSTTARQRAEFEEFTKQRWALVQLVADHGYLERSKALAVHVQLLQDCVDANKALQAKYAATHSKQCPDNDLSTQPDACQHSLHGNPMQQHPAGQVPAHPPEVLQLHGSVSTGSLSTSSNSSAGKQPGPAPPPPAPPPPGHNFLRPVPGKPRLLGAAGQVAAGGPGQGPIGAGAAKPPPPPPGPPPPHHFRAGAAAGAAGSGSSSRGVGRPAPPPPPGPPPPHSFGTKAPGLNSSSDSSQQQQRGSRPPPPPPPLPPGGFGACGSPLKSPNSSATAAAGSQPGKAPPPPPPLPPLGFNGLKTPPRPKTAPGSCSGSSSAGLNSSGLLGFNAIAAAAAAAGARRVQQEGGEPTTPKGAALVSHSSFGSGLVSPQAAEGAAAGGSSCGKLKRLHVERVPEHRIADGTFWRLTGNLVLHNEGFLYSLKRMFSNAPANSRRATDGSGGGADGAAAEDAAAKVIKVIADKRALQVEVCIKRLRMDAPELAAALNRIDTDKLKQDDLPQIRSMLPKPDELKEITTAKSRALREHSAKVAALAAAAAGDGSSGGQARTSSSSTSSEGEPALLPPRLSVVEAAFETLGGVRMLMAKMRACEFKYDIESVSAQVDDFVADLSFSLASFRSCGQLQYLLSIVRDTANTMNASAVQGAPMEGLSLQSLPRLQSTRVPGQTDVNVLHFIVGQLTLTFPAALELEAEREAFKAVTKHGTFDTVLAHVRRLRDMHKRLSTDLTKASEHLKHHSPSPAHNASRSSTASPAAAAAGDGSSSSSSSSSSTPAAESTVSPDDTAVATSPASTAADAEQQQIYVERLTELLGSSGSKIDSMQRKMEGVIQQFRWTVEYYAEDVNAPGYWKQQPAAFITQFLDLLEAIETTRKDTARVAKVISISTQFQEERQRREEEEADAAAAAAAAAAEEAGVQLGWDGDEEQQQQYLQEYEEEYEEGYATPGDHLTPYHDAHSSGSSPDGEHHQQQRLDEGEQLRLSRTNSWVIGVARSLQFGSGGGSNGEAGGDMEDEGEGEGSETGSCCEGGAAAAASNSSDGGGGTPQQSGGGSVEQHEGISQQQQQQGAQLFGLAD